MSPNGNTGNGTSNNTLDYFDQAGDTYHRAVDAASNKIISDQQNATVVSAASQLPLLSNSVLFNALAGLVRLPGGRQN